MSGSIFTKVPKPAPATPNLRSHTPVPKHNPRVQRQIVNTNIQREPKKEVEELSIFKKVPKPMLTRHDGTIFATVYFAKNGFLLEPASLKLVQTLSEELKLMLNPTVVVHGYASTEGSEKYNLNLSELRRLAVTSFLGAKGKVGGKAFGESKSAASETAKDPKELENQRQFNRRVEIMILPSPTVPKVPPAEPEKKKIELFPPLKIKPETLEERLKRILREPLPKPVPKRSIFELIEKKLDETLGDAGIPKKYRGPIIDAIKKGSLKLLDVALDTAGVSGKYKEAIKKAVEAGGKTKFMK